jgi:ACT domain-containing protein
MKQQDNPILTVIGEDKKGIVAQISTVLWEEKINIEEIRQGIIDGKFFMVMSINIEDSHLDFGQISEKLKKIGKEVSLDISLYNKSIFSAMHKI